MLNKLTDFIRRYDMLQKGDTVICAVSGGADSMALLFALYLLQDKLGIGVRAAHFNHRLRGEESQDDESFVRAFCDRFSITLDVGTAEIIPGKKGLEAAAREARYRFLYSLDGKIATAHTADDNTETVLMHMVRGTGLKGLGGIAPVRDRVIRPMLQITRQQVLAFLEEYHVPYREDSSNASDVFLRNRLRHHVIPLLKQENPSLAQNVSAMALRLRLDEQALQPAVDFSEGLCLDTVQAMLPAQRSRVLAAFLEHCGVKEPEAEHVAMVQSLLDSKRPSAYASFPGDVTLRRCYGTVQKATSQPALQEVRLQCPGTTYVPQLGVDVVCRPADKIVQTENIFTVNVTGDLVLRSRQSGDVMRLSGGSKSLKKLFIDRKIPAGERQNIPVLADEKGVLAVCGIGVNLERAAVSLPAIRLHLQPHSCKEKEAEEQTDVQ